MSEAMISFAVQYIGVLKVHDCTFTYIVHVCTCWEICINYSIHYQPRC